MIHYDEIPIDDPDIFVNNAFASMESEPIAYAEAMQRAESRRWQAAMEKEVKSLLDAGTWEPIERATVPRNHRVLRASGYTKVKRDGTYKARWVVKGFEEVKGLTTSRYSLRLYEQIHSGPYWPLLPPRLGHQPFCTVISTQKSSLNSLKASPSPASAASC